MQAVSPAADIVTRTIGEVEGLQIVPESEARDIVCELTGANSCDVVAFGTEAGLFQAAGMSAVICGPGSILQAHKPDEYVSLDQLAACMAMLGRLGAKLTA
jgi:acetylornithine deacetylase